MGYVLALVVAATILYILFKRSFSRVVVYEYEAALRYRNGRLQGALGPGTYWQQLPTTTIVKLDTRPQTLTIGSQEILTADNVSLKLSIVATYAVADVQRAILSSQSYRDALYIAAQVTLRELVAIRPLDELLAARQGLSTELREALAPAAEEVGLRLDSAQVRDITLPAELKRSYAQVLRARQEGLAALERARGESAALRNLANTARMLDSNPSLLQLRALLAVSDSGGNVVFNLPTATTTGEPPVASQSDR